MSRATQLRNLTKSEFYLDILTDPFFKPETRVLLMYVLEVKGVYYLKDKQAYHITAQEVNLTETQFNRALKQLKEVGMVTDVRKKKEIENENCA